MNVNNIYIISWFGNNTEIREKRRIIHDRQLTWIQNQNLTPVILAQHYENEEYKLGIDYEKIEKNQSVLLPAAARNVLLERFYNSDDDFALFADNDTRFYNGPQHGDSANFIELIRSFDIDKFEDIDLVQFTNPARTPFTKTLSKDLFKKNLVFRRAYTVYGPIFLIKNIKKHHNKEIYFSADNFQTQEGKIINGEEIDFGVKFLMNGLKCYSTMNVIYDEMGRTKSTWTVDNKARSNATAWSIINQTWNREFRPSNRFDWKVIPEYKQIEKVIIIPKITEGDNKILTELFDFSKITVDYSIKDAIL
jgi:hypothetical protein